MNQTTIGKVLSVLCKIYDALTLVNLNSNISNRRDLVLPHF